MDSLLPEQTAVITDVVFGPESATWQFSGPMLTTRQSPAIAQRIISGIANRIGLASNDYVVSSVKYFLKKHKVRVLLGEYLDQSLYWLKLAKAMGIRAFGHAHGYDISQVLRDAHWRSEYLFYNQLDGIIAPTLVSQRRLITLGIEPSKIHVVPYGIDLAPNIPDRHQANSDKIICLAAGRMTPKKAPILLLESFRRAAINDRRLFLNYVGAGELLPAAIQFVQAFNLQDRVTFLGTLPHDELLSQMRTSHIFLQHSVVCPLTGDEEGLPIAILEAMSAALPVVSTIHAGIPEAISDEETGLLVPEGDTEGMANRILRLANDQKIRQELGQAGRRRVARDFSWSDRREKLRSILGLHAPDKGLKKHVQLGG